LKGADAIWSALSSNLSVPLFTNPGTTEIHFVDALARHERIHPVLCLFEGVAAGAADGYARVSGRPGLALFHLGPGLANAAANLHNARRAHSPVLALVGDHPGRHRALDPPLASDIEALAQTFSCSVETVANREDLGPALHRSLEALARPPKGVSTLIVPADIAASQGSPISPTDPSISLHYTPEAALLTEAAEWLRKGSTTALVVDGDALSPAGSLAIDKLRRATGVRVYAPTFPSVMDRGGSVPIIDRLAYLPEMAHDQLKGAQRMVLIGAKRPVTFFATPPLASRVGPDEVLELVPEGFLTLSALELLTQEIRTTALTLHREIRTPSHVTGALTPEVLAEVVADHIQEGTIVVDEANTSGIFLAAATSHAPQHRWLSLTGGAIGQGLPVALGAALGAPNNPVICLESDGSALYTIQALHAMAREETNTAIVILHNTRYAILDFELDRIAPNSRSSLFDLAHPDLDFVALAKGFGMPACQVSTGEALDEALAHKGDGPFLIAAHLS